MKTTHFNPSPLESELANAIEKVKGEIEKHITDNKIIEVRVNDLADNPSIKMTTEDKDGDQHMFTLRIIQKPE